MPESVDELWTKTFRAKLRSQVRRPTKDGMTARCGPAELAPFYDVFARNMRDLGTPVLPRAFFERIAAVFGDRVVFATVYTTEGMPAAAACCLVWRDELEVTWASSIRELNRLSPNMLLYARLMEEAIGRGVRLFNFGRCTPDGPTHRFKQQWGGDDVPLPWAYWSRSGAAGTPSPDRPLFRVATAVWSRLPMAIANRLGPVLARQLP
jgi:FemAB-related protein (PEP-CTERM system-associated)